MMAEQVAMLLDTSKCMACRGCQVACKQWNKLSAVETKFTGTYQNPPWLSAKTWTLIKFIEPDNFKEDPRWLFRKVQCFHCTDAACEQVCPTGAIKKHENGIVAINQSICAGCKYCVQVCPFGVPHADRETGTAKKCWMCLDRVSNGLTPACAKACPTGAILFGSRIEMLAHAKKREQILKDQGFSPRIYGENELKGLHVITVLTESATIYGLPEKPRKPTEMIFWRWLLAVIPGLAILAGIFGYLFKTKSEPVAEPESKVESGGK